MPDVEHYAFIPYRSVVEWLSLGWEIAGRMPAPHSHWSLLGRWTGEGEPKTPKEAML